MEDVAIAKFPRRKSSWLHVLLKHGIMLKAEAVVFLHDVEDAAAVVAKLGAKFPYLHIATIAPEVRLLPCSRHTTARA